MTNLAIFFFFRLKTSALFKQKEMFLGYIKLAVEHILIRVHLFARSQSHTPKSSAKRSLLKGCGELAQKLDMWSVGRGWQVGESSGSLFLGLFTLPDGACVCLIVQLSRIVSYAWPWFLLPHTVELPLSPSPLYSRGLGSSQVIATCYITPFYDLRRSNFSSSLKEGESLPMLWCLLIEPKDSTWTQIQVLCKVSGILSHRLEGSRRIQRHGKNHVLSEAIDWIHPNITTARQW